MAPRQGKETRSGLFVPQGDGHSAFVPKPLPPTPPIELDSELLALLEQSGTELGRLDGIARVIPEPDLFVAMYVRREAVLSSQIEGTQSTLDDVLEARSTPGHDLAQRRGGGRQLRRRHELRPRAAPGSAVHAPDPRDPRRAAAAGAAATRRRASSAGPRTGSARGRAHRTARPSCRRRSTRCRRRSTTWSGSSTTRRRFPA